MSTPPPPPPGFNPPPPAYGGPQYGTPAPQQQYGAPPPGYQPYQGYPQQQQQRQYAGFGSRLGAILLDGIIGAIFGIPAAVAFFAVPKHYADCTIDGEPGVCKVPTGAGWGIIIGLGIVFGLAYFVIYIKKVGNNQSWGQKAVSIRVVTKDTGAQIGVGRSVGRFFARYISGIPCYLGYLWMLWDKDKQTWHDKIVGSVVVKE
jgi:uncharacterized RDD family membrane protein YckC